VFRRLTQFSYQRSFVEAIGFYLAYLFLSMIIGGIAGASVALFSSHMDHATIFMMSARAGGFATVVLNGSIVCGLMLAKRLSLGYILAIPLAMGLALVGGGLLGAIPAAVMSTRPFRMENA